MLCCRLPNSISPLRGFLLLTLLLAAAFIPSLCRAQSNPSSAVRVLLPNGARLLLKSETETNRVVIALFVRTPQEEGSEAAVGEMVARTLFYGNANRTQNGILTLAGEAGGSLEVLHTAEYVAITYAVAPSRLPEAAHLVCDCLKSAEFAPESLQRALQTARAERQRRREDGFTLGYDALRQALGYSVPTEEQLARVTQAQAQTYFRRHYGPARTVIAVVGHFNSAQVISLFSGFLAAYDRALPPLASEKADAPLTNALPARPALLRSPASAAYVLVGAPSPPMYSPDYPAFTVLLALLGGGHASRLFQQAREQSGVGYEVGAFSEADRAGPLAAFLQWNPRRSTRETATSAPVEAANATSDSVARLLTKQFDDLLTTSPTEAEVTRARNYAIGQYALRHEQARDRAFYLGWYETLGRGFAFDEEFPRLLAAVTPEDVQRAAQVYLKTRASVIVAPTSVK